MNVFKDIKEDMNTILNGNCENKKFDEKWKIKHDSEVEFGKALTHKRKIN